MKKIYKYSIRVALGFMALWSFAELTTGEHNEDVIAAMPYETYYEIVDTLTFRNGGQKPSDKEIVTLYYQRYRNAK